jgi:hypothetical protein
MSLALLALQIGAGQLLSCLCRLFQAVSAVNVSYQVLNSELEANQT